MSEIQKRGEEISKLKIEVKLGKVKDTTSLKRKSDELAVLKTIFNEKRTIKEVNTK